MQRRQNNSTAALRLSAPINRRLSILTRRTNDIAQRTRAIVARARRRPMPRAIGRRSPLAGLAPGVIASRAADRAESRGPGVFDSISNAVCDVISDVALIPAALTGGAVGAGYHMRAMCTAKSTTPGWYVQLLRTISTYLLRLPGIGSTLDKIPKYMLAHPIVSLEALMFGMLIWFWLRRLSPQTRMRNRWLLALLSSIVWCNLSPEFALESFAIYTVAGIVASCLANIWHIAIVFAAATIISGTVSHTTDFKDIDAATTSYYTSCSVVGKHANGTNIG